VKILVGDIGGTKTLLALVEGPDAASLRETRRQRFENAREDGLAPILERFLEGAADVDAAAFGIAGPVDDGVCRATNLPWVIDARALSDRVSIPHVALLNDLEAIALGVGALGDRALVTLQHGEPDPAAPAAVIGAGTGLGEAILVPDPARGLPRVLATEGGHVDFAPRDEAEMSLLRFAQARHGRVSLERIVSGVGLSLIYDHVVASGEAPASPTVEAVPGDGDRSAAIGEVGMKGDEPAARIALDRFVSLYGAAAGNLALTCLPFGGLYVAGGIAPKILDRLRDGPFLASLLDKGRMRRLLERLHVQVVTDPSVGLLGARRQALCKLGDASVCKPTRS